MRARADHEEFLSLQPSWLRKVLQGDHSLTAAELADMNRVNWPKVFGEAQDQYLVLLDRNPKGLREYRKVQKKIAVQIALLNVPSVRRGRPRKDAIATESMDLIRRGLSYAKIAIELNRKYGPNTTNKEAIRSLIRSRRALRSGARRRK